MGENYEVIRINEQTWRIDEQHGVRFFLLLGSKKALLIDSGMTVQNAKEIAQGLTDLPIELLNTHADRDHVGSNDEFEAPYMHPSEASNYHNSQGKCGEITPIWDGDELELGDRKLKIIALPGHTPGSIAVLDKKYRLLFSGDPIQDGRIFMFGVQRDFTAYRHSLVRLLGWREEFDEIYPSHGTCPLYMDQIEKLIHASEEILSGGAEYEKTEFRGMPLRIYHAQIADFLCPAEE